MNKSKVHKSKYQASIFIARFISFTGWLSLAISTLLIARVFLLFLTSTQMSPFGVESGKMFVFFLILVMISSLFLVAIGQIMRSMIDSSDYLRNIFLFIDQEKKVELKEMKSICTKEVPKEKKEMKSICTKEVPKENSKPIIKAKRVVNINEHNSSGMTKLMLAAKKLDLKKVKNILEAGAAPSLKNEIDHGATAAIYAQRNINISMTESDKKNLENIVQLLKQYS